MPVPRWVPFAASTITSATIPASRASEADPASGMAHPPRKPPAQATGQCLQHHRHLASWSVLLRTASSGQHLLVEGAGAIAAASG